MKKLILLLSACCSVMAWAQPYPIGHKTITYNDPGRSGGYGSGGGSGRQIQCEVYYPATVAGDNTPFAATVSPVITFGHGFVMSWDAYNDIWEHLVPQGYVVIFPRTEGGISPVHADFGKDLMVVSNRFTTDCSDVSFFAYQHWNGKQAVMGHSMGGGSTFLAASDSDSDFDLLVGLAPAETNPSAISAAANVTIPSVIFSGSEDAVAPPQNHQIPIYQGLASSCSQLFSITGGGHCYFANSNLSCDFGEGTSGGNITISRTEQQNTLFAGLDPLLEFYLMGNCSAWADYEAYFSDSRIQTTNNCSYTPLTAPVIVINGTIVSTTVSGNLQWFLNGVALSGETNPTLEAATYGNGTYTVVLTDNSGCQYTSNEIAVGDASVANDGLWLEYVIFPVPSSEVITIQASQYLDQELIVRNVLGIEVDRFVMKEAINHYSIAGWSSGLYFVYSSNRQVGVINKR